MRVEDVGVVRSRSGSVVSSRLAVVELNYGGFFFDSYLLNTEVPKYPITDSYSSPEACVRSVFTVCV